MMLTWLWRVSKGLLEAFTSVGPNIEINYCTMHIWTNFSKKMEWDRLRGSLGQGRQILMSIWLHSRGCQLMHTTMWVRFSPSSGVDMHSVGSIHDEQASQAVNHHQARLRNSVHLLLLKLLQE